MGERKANIEDLLAENEQLRQDWETVFPRVQAENERLREALRKCITLLAEKWLAAANDAFAHGQVEMPWAALKDGAAILAEIESEQALKGKGE